VTDLAIALIGRPNAGKSSLYNALTGGDAHVGNYPGITVDILESDIELPSGRGAVVCDVPGFYSVDAKVGSGADEEVARTFLHQLRDSDREHVVVHVLDATRLALGLRLTRELVAAKIPLFVVLTQKDLLAREGHTVDVATLSREIGAPVVFLSTRDPDVKPMVLSAIDAHALKCGEGSAAFDPLDLARRVVCVPDRARRATTTERIDRVLLHPIAGPIFFLAIMLAVFASVFLVADPASSAMTKLVELARTGITGSLGKNLVTSFIVDGVLGGAGTVIAFMPQVVILTIALEVLEASGYLARGAFLVDRALRLIGLSGSSFLPLLLGHACAVPAIQSTRIVRDVRERLTSILVLPLMTCSARLPTYGLIIATFFAARSAMVKAALFVSLYSAGIAIALCVALVLRRTATRGKGLPLVLEMPAYRMPLPSVVMRKAVHAAKRFVRDVGTVIVAVSAVLWVLVTVPMPGSKGEPGISSSIAASIGRTIEPVTKAAGFDWRIDVGLIGAFGAREVMVGTMGVIFGVENAEESPAPLTEHLRSLYTMRTGLALLAFFVIACQCMSTVAAIRRETRSWRWPAFVVGYTYALGYAAAVLVYQVGGLLGMS
jgi:ferrous iron transport protein B